MGNLALGSTAADLPDRYNHDTAVNVARATFTISNSLIILYMTVVQYLLIRIRLAKSKIRHPTFAETYLLVTVLWLVHRILDTLLSVLMDATVESIWDWRTSFRYLDLRDSQAFGLGYWVHVPVAWTWQSNVNLVFWDVLATWLISTSLSLSRSLLPQILEACQNPNRAFAQFKARFFELVVFARHLFQEAHAIFPPKSTSRRKIDNKKECDDGKVGRTVELQRHQDENALKGQRTLDWDLKVDKESLQEMMETLGPPGGFGELGFNISKDKVCFGAMGIGTRFNLNFVLETEQLQDSKKCLKKTKRTRSKS